MEIKEAIDILLDTDLTCYGYSKKEVDEAGNMGAEALEKQIPKKPVIEEDKVIFGIVLWSSIRLE